MSDPLRVIRTVRVVLAPSCSLSAAARLVTVAVAAWPKERRPVPSDLVRVTGLSASVVKSALREIAAHTPGPAACVHYVAKRKPEARP